MGVNVLSCYDGMACGMAAMQESGVDVNRYVAYEVDKYAIKTATHNFPKIEEMGDVFKADFTKYEGFDWLIGGSPCFTSGQLVLTDKGYKDISEVEIGDMVLTHKNRFMPVTRLYEREADTVAVKIQGYPEFITTENHPFYTIKSSWGGFSEVPAWTKVSDMTFYTFCGQHIHAPSGKNEYNLTERECFSLGRYLSDGYVADNLLSSKRVTEVIGYFGTESSPKKIPEFMFDLPYFHVDKFIRGYLSGDEVSYGQKVLAATTSKELAFGLQRLICSHFREIVDISVKGNGESNIIDGKEAKVDFPFYKILFGNAHIQNGIMWTKVENVRKTGKTETVYNIEVEEDHSYTVNNCIVHNCTFWSIAQKNNRETVASGMGWDLFCQYVRALKEAKPKYFLYENNKSMSSSIRDSIRETFGFEEICINSALVSAQNRQRYYWVGKRNADGTYSKVHIEQPVDRGILLKDVLDGYDLTSRDKSFVLTASYNGAVPWNTIERSQRTMVAEPIRIGGLVRPNGEISTSAGMRVYDINGKSRYLCANGGGQGAKTGLYAIPVAGRNIGRRINEQGHRDDYNKNIECIQRYEVNEDPSKTNCLSTVYKDNMIACPVCVAQRKRYDEEGCGFQNYETREDGKTNVLTKVSKDNYLAIPVLESSVYAIATKFSEDGTPIRAISGSDKKEHSVYLVSDGEIFIRGKGYPIKLADGYYIIRKLTVDECKRLQTIPDWYEFPVSKTQSLRMLGNGWTVSVISHQIKSALESQE